MIKITYPRGRMTINKDVFLSTCGVTKFRKLLKVIKMSHTPDWHIEDLRKYMTEYINASDDIKCNLTADINKYEIQLGALEQTLVTLTYKRGQVEAMLSKILTYTTYRSEEYKLTKESKDELTQSIKDTRNEAVSIRSKLRGAMSEYKRVEKNCKNYSKYLEILKEVC